MNFLAHLYIAEARGADAAGAVLGDAVRGSDLSHLPPTVAASIHLHRRIDAAFDRHPRTQRVLRGIADREARRYAPITLDLYADFWLARHWAQWHTESFADFCRRMAAEVAASGEAFAAAGVAAPSAARFARVLLSVAEVEGIDTAIARIAQRSRDPERLLRACADWRTHGERLEPGLPELMRACLKA